jgi:hypothetical protein
VSYLPIPLLRAALSTALLAMGGSEALARPAAPGRRDHCRARTKSDPIPEYHLEVRRGER